MYRKFKADHIFTGYEILPDTAVLVTDESGAVVEIIDARDAGEEVQPLKGLLTPGFINAHCHIELSHLKDKIPTNTGLVEFVQLVMTGRASVKELKLQAMMDADIEMYQNGIVAVGDICNTADSIPVKQQSKLLWHNFIEVSGFTGSASRYRLEEMRKVFEAFRVAFNDQQVTFSPHAPYSVSKQLFELLNEETALLLITIHNQECLAENELYRQKEGEFLSLYKDFGIDISSFEATGKSSFQSWLPYFNKGQSIISVHNTFTGIDDLAFAEKYIQNTGGEVFYCICINANKHIEGATPPVGLLSVNKGNTVVGTDSYASNEHLNILEELKTIQQSTNPLVPLPELLKWATVNGARALQIDHLAGSFEKGKTPGIVLIEGLENLQFTPGSSSRRIL